MDCSQPVFSVFGILQTRILDWLAIGAYLITEGLRPPRQQPLGLGPEPDPPLVGDELLCQRDPQGSHHEVSIHLLVPRRPVLQTWGFSLAKKIKGECQSER